MSKQAPLYQRLEALPADDFEFSSQLIADEMPIDLVSAEDVEDIVRFIAEHPEIEFGNPGPLTHLIEKLPSAEYASIVARSVTRSPTDHTMWLLHRIMNSLDEESDAWRRLNAIYKQGERK